MQSLYDPTDAQRAVDRYAPKVAEDLALRVYTSRLLGKNPALVLHGGGNTSVKSRVTELLGDVTDVLYIKGSGTDLAFIEPSGFPACRLAHLRRCCERTSMTDEEMVGQLRGQMIDPASPTPSVEALLHAYLPAKFVDHTHADAILAVVDQPRSDEAIKEIFGDRALFIPYVMPGFALARRVAEMFRARTARGGIEPALMILDKHGIFTWGQTAKESYERMIRAVTRAEEYIDSCRAPASRRTLSPPSRDAYWEVAPIIRGALTRASGRPWILSFRAGANLIAFSERDDLAAVSQVGCATPDHVIRTKALPMLLRPRDPREEAPVFRARVEASLKQYEAAYHDYFRRCSAARLLNVKELDPLPRVILIPGLGALTAGRSSKDAEIAADIYEHTASVIDAASALNGYRPVTELDLFDVEYWSLEQAKLGKAKDSAEGSLARRIAFVTGAASGIGLGSARALLGAGAHVMLTDRNAEALENAAAGLSTLYPGRVVHERCDVTAEADVRRAIGVTIDRFGGIDLVLSNAGTAPGGALHTANGDAALRASLEVNLLGHQTVARLAAEVLIAQGTGGALLFNASKSAFNPGAEFGPYAVPKAALIALMRQYAIDLAPHGVRSNAVNADRIRTDLFAGGLALARAKARGVPLDEYFRANLLRRETSVDDVARAFLYLATAEATTGCVITVDGGNAAAFPR